MPPSVLFTTICQPVERLAGFSALDQMAYRLTRGQELFVLYEHTHCYPLHLLAQNLSGPSVVLENPRLEQLEQELKRSYDFVAINFDMLNAGRLQQMCRLIRKTSPSTRVVLGGYGAICAPYLLAEPGWQGLVDHVCRQEGVAFMRSLLGQDPRGEIRCCLPKGGSSLPWLNPGAPGTIGVVLSGLGCRKACPFCTTSAYTGGRYVELMDAEQIFAAIKGYWRRSPLTSSITIYDENFLDQPHKVRALGRLIQQDRQHGLEQLNYFAFGSLSALAQYDPDELLLSGLDTLWVGVESKFSSLPKRLGLQPADAFSMLHSLGIKTVGSWIIGEDFQNSENIAEDMEFFTSLDPCFQQLSVLTVAPGTPLWDQLEARGRAPRPIRWDQHHLYGQTFEARGFSHPQMLELLERMYERIYTRKGPALMKVLEADLNGYEHCARSSHSLLRQRKAAYFRGRCQSYLPLLRTALALAPSEAVRSRLEDLDRRYRELVGPPSATDQAMGDAILERAEQELRRHRDGGELRPEEPFRRYTYRQQGSRPAGRPYLVEYPEDHLPSTARACAP